MDYYIYYIDYYIDCYKYGVSLEKKIKMDYYIYTTYNKYGSLSFDLTCSNNRQSALHITAMTHQHFYGPLVVIRRKTSGKLKKNLPDERGRLR